MITIYNTDMRTIVDLPERQIEALAKLSEKENTSRAAIIRLAIDDYIEKHQAALSAAFGLWKDKPIDGLEYQERLRSEWD